VIKVYQGTRGVKSVTASGSARSLLVKGLKNGASYSFTVAAQNSLGPGPASARSAAVTTR
jgi:hypothetical protein